MGSAHFRKGGSCICRAACMGCMYMHGVHVYAKKMQTFMNNWVLLIFGKWVVYMQVHVTRRESMDFKRAKFFMKVCAFLTYGIHFFDSQDPHLSACTYIKTHARCPSCSRRFVGLMQPGRHKYLGLLV